MRKFIVGCQLSVLATIFVAWALVLLVALSIISPIYQPPASYWHFAFSQEGEFTTYRFPSGSAVPEAYDRNMQFLGFHRPGDVKCLGLAHMVTSQVDHNRWRLWQWHSPRVVLGQYDTSPIQEREEEPTSGRIWFWLPDEEVLEAYDSNTRKKLGRLGSDGFLPEGDPRPFTGFLGPCIWQRWMFSQTTWVLLPTRTSVHLAHLLDNSVRTVVEKQAPEIEDASMVRSLLWEPFLEQLGEGAAVYVKTSDRIECYDTEGNLVGSFTLAPAEKRASLLEVGRTRTNDFVIVTRPDYVHVDGATVRWLDGAGNTLDEAKLHEPESADKGRPRLRSLIRGLLVPLPYLAWGSNNLYRWERSTLTPLTVGTALIAGLLCALVIGLLARRALVPAWKTVLWCVFGLTCGAAALLTYFTAASRPRLERCSACGRAKALSALKCPRCGAEVPRPPEKGIEIFA